MTPIEVAGSVQAASAGYWGRIFKRNQEFCSWQAPQQLHVLNAVRACLNETLGPLSVLDFGVGSMGLYRSLGDELMRRITLSGISESPQHDPADPLFARYRIRIAIGPGLSPLAHILSHSQDQVVCTYVFAYLDAPQRAAALAAFTRVLVPGGRLILVLHHPHGERARKFRRAEPYWPKAHRLYALLLQGRYGEASARLQDLTDFLNEAFGQDHAYRSYLASYLKTATRFLATFCVDTIRVYSIPIPDEALIDCEDAQRWIERELAMTCQSFHPVENPALDLPLPAELTLARLEECVDPGCGAPIANVMTAIKRRERS
jgi:SAM-dependent methyltransferase